MLLFYFKSAIRVDPVRLLYLPILDSVFEEYILNSTSKNWAYIRLKLPTRENTRYLLKPRSNNRNTLTQPIATLLAATCCARLATHLRRVATCWVMLGQVWKRSNLSQHVAKRKKHVAPNNVTICG